MEIREANTENFQCPPQPGSMRSVYSRSAMSFTRRYFGTNLRLLTLNLSPYQRITFRDMTSWVNLRRPPSPLRSNYRVSEARRWMNISTSWAWTRLSHI